MKKSLQNKTFSAFVFVSHCIIMLSVIMQSTITSAYGQTVGEKTFRLKLENATVTAALLEINRLGNNVVVFKKEETDKESSKVTLNLSKATALAAVKATIAGTNLSFKEQNGKIIIIPVQSPPPKKCRKTFLLEWKCP